MPKDIVSDATVQIEPGRPVELQNGEFVANAQFTRAGDDLHLSAPDGQEVVIEGYFAQNPAPDIVTTDGAHLSPDMVEAFLPPQHVAQYAQALSNAVSDASPAGQVTEVMGEATIVRADGTRVPAMVGTPVYSGDVIETSKDGAVNILFSDNTTFAISENARLSIDEYAYNASEQDGTSFFSMLQGVFVYTSGLIGKTDPGHVSIETPVGSIGIRGTVVAGDINPAGQESKITIVDGAIVLTNQGGTLELNDSFETASISSYTQEPANLGQINSASFASSYSAVSSVVTGFSSIGSASPANGNSTAPANGTEAQSSESPSEAPAQAPQQNATPETGPEAPAPVAPAPILFTPPAPPAPEPGSDFNTDAKTDFQAPSEAAAPAPAAGAEPAAPPAAAAPPAPQAPPPTDTTAPVAGGPNTAPGGADRAINLAEDVQRSFTISDFGFVDNNGNRLGGVIIDSLPASGTLMLSGTPITSLPQFVSASAIANGALSYKGGANAFGANFASIDFRVVDDGGTVNGGTDVDPTPNTFTFNIAPVNDAPTLNANNVLIRANGIKVINSGMLSAGDVDTPPNLLTYTVLTGPQHGTLERFNGASWVAATSFTQADITAGAVRYVNNGSFFASDSFNFRLSDGAVQLATSTFNITVPVLTFAFANHYLNNTPGNVSDDGFRLFGSTWGVNEVVGSANLAGFTGTHTFELTYQKGANGPVTLTTSGNILGDGYVDNTTTGGNPYDTNVASNIPLFHFDASTGTVTLLNPLALNGFINGDFNFTLTARDGGNAVIDTHNFTFVMPSFNGPLSLGTAGDDGNVNSGTQGTGGITLTGGNQAAFSGDGNDRIVVTGTGNYVDAGNGDDLIVVNAAQGANGVIQGGAGLDRLVLGGLNITYDFTHGDVTGVGFSTPMEMGKVTGINKIDLAGGSTMASDLILTVRDIFEMTDGDHTLFIKTNLASGQYGNVFLHMADFTVTNGALGTVSPSPMPDGTGQVTLTATYNSQSVTLIIDQGDATSGVVVTNY